MHSNLERSTPSSASPKARIRRATSILSSIIAFAALATLGFTEGMLEVTLGSRSDDLRTLLGISMAELGTIHAAFSIGLWIGSLVVRPLDRLVGDRLTLLISVILCFSPLITIADLLEIPSAADLPAIGGVWLAGGTGAGILNPILAARNNQYRFLKFAVSFVMLFQFFKVAGLALGAWIGDYAIATALSVVDHFRWVGVLALIAAVLAALVPGKIEAETSTPPVYPARRLTLVGLGLIAAAAAVVLNGAIGFASVASVELGMDAKRGGDALFGFCAITGLALLVTQFIKRRSCLIAVCGLSIACVGAIALATAAAGHELRLLAGDTIFVLTAAGFVLLGLGTGPLIGFALRATGNIAVGAWSEVGRLATVMSIQFLLTAGFSWLLGNAGVWIAARFGIGVGATTAYAGICLVAIVATLVFGQRLFDYADRPEAAAPGLATPAAPEQLTITELRDAPQHGGPIIELGDDAALVDVLACADPERVLGDVAALLAALRAPDAPDRPERLLIPVVDVELEPHAEPRRVAHIDPQAELVERVGALLQIAGIDSAHALTGEPCGTTLVLTVRLHPGADIEELREWVHDLTALYTGIARKDGKPVRRVVVAMAVATADVESAPASTAPVVDLDRTADVPLAERVQQIGRTLAALWEHAAEAERLLVPLAECPGEGAPNEYTPALVFGMSGAVARYGGAQRDGWPIVVGDGLFVPVAGRDPAKAARTAALLSDQLRVGTITVGRSLPTAP